MPRKPLDGVERHTCPRGKRPPVSLCPTASAGVGAEGAAPPTRDWFLGMPPGRPFFPKRAKRAGEPVPPPVGATPRARRVETRRAARPSVRSALRRSTRLLLAKGKRKRPPVKAPKAAREQDGSVWKSLVYVTLYIRFPNLATRRAALAGERLRESLLSAVPPPQKEDGQPD